MDSKSSDDDRLTEVKSEMETKKQISREVNDTTKLHSSSDLPSIFKLNTNCFREVFDWLSLKDLIAIGQTCKHLQRIAGDLFQLNYVAKCGRGQNDGIYILSLQSNIFGQYIQKISISGDHLRAYQFVGKNCNANSIKHFRAYGSLPINGFEYIEGILKGIEVLEMNECFINGEFYEDYLKYCPNLKSLNITRSGRVHNKSIIIGSGNEWLLRQYPSIKHFELAEIHGLEQNELQTFFMQNPNVQTFSTDSRGFWQNRYAFLQSNITINTLSVDIYQTKLYDSNGQPISMVESVYQLLVELHKQQFYEHLHLYMVFISQENISKLCTLEAIEMLNGDIIRMDRFMPDVKVFAVWCGDEIFNIENVPANLPNLERIHMWKVTSSTILPFVRSSSKLRQIRIGSLKDLMEFKHFDMSVWNAERRKCVGACKLFIYINEDAYLAAKWAMKSIDFELVGLKRLESNEWEELCSRTKYFKSF